MHTMTHLRLALAVSALAFLSGCPNEATLTFDVEKASGAKFKVTYTESSMSDEAVAIVSDLTHAGLAVVVPAGLKVENPKLVVNGDEKEAEAIPESEMDSGLRAKIVEAISNAAVRLAAAVDPLIAPTDLTTIPLPQVGDMMSFTLEFEILTTDPTAELPNRFDVYTTWAFMLQGESEYRIGTFDPDSGAFFEDTVRLTRVTLQPVPDADINGDCNVGFEDLTALLNSWGPCAEPCLVHCPADISGDCEVGFADLTTLLATWGPCEVHCPWDFNGDAVVDELDLGILNAHAGPCPPPPQDCPWDLDGDEYVGNFGDLQALLNHFGPCP